MMKTLALAAVCSVVATGAFAGFQTTLPPESGTYAVSVYVESAKGGCLDLAQTQYSAVVNFGGLASVTTYIKIPITAYPKSLAMVSVQTLTTKTGKGTDSQSGTFTWVGNGFGENGWSENGNYTETITEIGTHTFAMKLTDTYASCVETIDVALVRTGVNQ